MVSLEFQKLNEMCPARSREPVKEVSVAVMVRDSVVGPVLADIVTESLVTTTLVGKLPMNVERISRLAAVVVVGVRNEIYLVNYSRI